MKKVNNSNSDKTQLLTQLLKVFRYEPLDTLTTDEMYSGQPFAILQCFLILQTSALHEINGKPNINREFIQ